MTINPVKLEAKGLVGEHIVGEIFGVVMASYVLGNGVVCLLYIDSGCGLWTFCSLGLSGVVLDWLLVATRQQHCAECDEHQHSNNASGYDEGKFFGWFFVGR